MTQKLDGLPQCLAIGKGVHGVKPSGPAAENQKLKVLTGVSAFWSIRLAEYVSDNNMSEEMYNISVGHCPR